MNSNTPDANINQPESDAQLSTETIAPVSNSQKATENSPNTRSHSGRYPRPSAGRRPPRRALRLEVLRRAREGNKLAARSHRYGAIPRHVVPRPQGGGREAYEYLLNAARASPRALATIARNSAAPRDRWRETRSWRVLRYLPAGALGWSIIRSCWVLPPALAAPEKVLDRELVIVIVLVRFDDGTHSAPRGITEPSNPN